MLGRRRTGNGMPAQVDPYSQRAADAESVYNADPEVPSTSYAAAKTPLNSRYAPATENPKTNAFFKNNAWRLNGLAYNWAWGSNDMGKMGASLPSADGGLNGIVKSSAFQPLLVQLHDWQTNTAWFAAGWNGTGSGMFQGSNPIRYTYPSFRVAQVNTSVTGGAGKPSMRMNRTPRFTSVQSIKKYTVVPSRYNTTGTNS